MYDTIIRNNPGLILPITAADLSVEIESRLDDAFFIGKKEAAAQLFALADAEAQALEMAADLGIQLESAYERTLKTAVFLATRHSLLYPEKRNIWLETARTMCEVDSQFITNN